MTTRKRIMAKVYVDELWHEGEDGWWVGLAPGYCCPPMNCHTVHEDTLKEVWEMVKEVRPCACPECLEHWKTVQPPIPDVFFDACRCADKAVRS